MRAVRFYRTRTGQCPARKFLDSLTPKQAQKVVWVLQLVEELEPVPVQYLKKLSGTEEIWEVRAQHGGNAFRLLGFFDPSNDLVLTNGFAKKSERTPRREIAVAEAHRRDDLTRRVRHE